MLKKALVVMLLMTSLSMEAVAQREAFITGTGGFSCGQYLADRQKDGQSYTAVQTSIYVSWIFGYLSGYNYFGSHSAMKNMPGVNDTIAYLDNYCINHPLRPVVNGADCLIADYGGMRTTYCKQ